MLAKSDARGKEARSDSITKDQIRKGFAIFCSRGKKSENRSIVPISQRTKIRSNNFSNHKTK